jgi:hypothetical protein
MDRIVAARGTPQTIRVDNGPEFVSRALDQWAYLHQVTLDFSRPGKPTDNALVESFNGRLRDECLNTNWFLFLDDARRKIEVGASTITRADLTLRWATFHPGNLRNRPRGTPAHEPGLLTSSLEEESGDPHQIIAKYYKLDGGEGGIRTLGTGYPVRQISNPNRRFHSVRAIETEKDDFPCRKATSGALCVPLG